jgi:subtilisin family serine protease
MQRPARRRALVALAATAALSTACLHPRPEAIRSPLDVPEGSVEPGAERQVLVLLRSTHPEVWQGVARDATAFLGLRLLYSWPMDSIGEQCLIFVLADGQDREEVLRRLAADRRVTAVQPVVRYRTLNEPPRAPAEKSKGPWNDAYASMQSGLENLGLAAAHRWATGRGVRIAVVDTGVDFEHPDLAGRVVVTRTFVPRGEGSFAKDVHGTAVAGLVAAGAGNGIGIVGVAPDARIDALKACWSDPPGSRQAACDSYSLARALDFALTQSADTRPTVLNLSLGGPQDPLLARLVARAETLGIVVIAAADPSGTLPFPASLPTVLAVAGDGPDAPKGPPVALTAPGVDVLSTGPNGAYDFFSGSSFAAAQAAGVAALMLERRPDLAPRDVRRLITAGARAAKGAGGTPPALDACGALAAALGRDACTETPG